MPYADRAKYLAHQKALYAANKAAYEERAKRAAAARPADVEAAYAKAEVANRRSAQKITGAALRSLPRECCAYCFGPATEIDHCTPLSRGGENTVDNIVWCCRRCNASKGSRTVLEFVCKITLRQRTECPRMGLDETTSRADENGKRRAG